MKISIFGLGYVGSVAAACLASRGHSVVGVDVYEEKVRRLNAGEAQISEPGLEGLIATGVAEGRLRATTDAAEAIASTSVSFICVGTPSAPGGDIDLSHVDKVVTEIASHLDASDSSVPHPIIMRSTMVPGSTRRYVEGGFASLVGSGKCVVYFYPEFLRQGTAIEDFLDPSLAALGCADPSLGLGDIAGLVDEEITLLDYEAAELLKYACNAFHATKVGFANEIGRLAKHLGIDGRAVMGALCEDIRLNISPYYMRPGAPFGGSCLPKDVLALDALADVRGIANPLLGAVMESNSRHIDHLYQLVRSKGEQEVAILGLTFKRDTDDLRGSAMVELAARLVADGCGVRIFDPWLNVDRLIGASRALVEEKLPGLPEMWRDDCASALEGASTVVVANRSVDLADLSAALGSRHRVIDVDGWDDLLQLGVPVEGICW